VRAMAISIAKATPDTATTPPAKGTPNTMTTPPAKGTPDTLAQRTARATPNTMASPAAQAPIGPASSPPAHSARRRSAGRWFMRPWAWALALAVPLALAYLLVAPPAADLSAAIYRSDLFARVGYTLRDNGWYAAHGHYLLGYSLLSPALGALLGVRWLLVIATLISTVLFGLIAERAFGPAAGRAAALVFALGACAEMLSGRVPYDLGMAIGLGAALAAICARWRLALGLALLTSAASPVAGAFLALVFLAWALSVWPERSAGEAERSFAPASSDEAYAPVSSHEAYAPVSSNEVGGARTHARARAWVPARGHRWAWPLALMIAALAPIAVLSLAFPEGGYEPFAPSSFWPAFAAVVAIAALLPPGPLSAPAHRAVRVGAVLYALALAASFAIASPMGGNAARLGPELAPALIVGVLWNDRRLALGLLAPVLLYWQLNTPIGDLSLVAGQVSAEPSYYAPLVSEVDRLSHGARTIIEIPLTATHAEAAYVAGNDHIALARGWDRQLDTRYAALFYRPRLTASAYRAWLAENRVQYVALADARLDYAGKAEGALVAHGLPYLREIWRSRHWRLFRVMS
jgi:hypothetical protein